MPRQNPSAVEELLPGKIRKRGCSSSASSSSSVIHNYRFKRAILVRKRAAGSTTPLPTWRLIGSSARTPSSASRAAVSSPKYAASLHGGGGGAIKAKQQQQGPVSARKLAATLWEMNEVPSPRMPETSDERRARKEAKARERATASRSVHSGSLPPHLSDPSHSPASEKGDRSGTGSRHRRSSSISQKLRTLDHNVAPFDSVSNASFMEIETRSRVQTPTGSTTGITKTRLKDVSSALTTSKELLKIINRVWGNEDRPSSSMSLMSALHSELERARLQVNQVIHEQRGDQNETHYLLKRFAEEKAAWKNKEQKLVEAAIESVELEKKLRRRVESLNKKLGKELSDTKASLVKVVKELEQEKRTRAVMEHVCDELANDIGEDKAEAEEIKRESVKLYEEVEKEREMLQLADSLREERVQMKLSEAKHQLEEKNAAVDKLRGQLEVFLGAKRGKEKGVRGFMSNHRVNDDDVDDDEEEDDHIRAYLSRAHLASYQDGDGEVENGELFEEEDTAESDLHSIELGLNSNNRSYKSAYVSATPHNLSNTINEDEIIMDRKSILGKVSRRSASLQRSASDVSGDARFSEFERPSHGKGYGEDVHGYRTMKGRRDLLLCGSGVETARNYGSSPNRHGVQQQGRLSAPDRPPLVPGIVSKSRLSESSGRKSRR